MKGLLTILIITAFLFFSCNKKNAPTPSSVTAFNFVNAVAASSPAVVAFSNSNITYSAWSNIAYGTSNLFSLVAGGVPLTLAWSTDTTKPFYQGTLALKTGNIYSFFVTGDTAATDTLFTQDIIPHYPQTDSVMGIRFVNLSNGSGPISINLEGSSIGSGPFSGSC